MLINDVIASYKPLIERILSDYCRTFGAKTPLAEACSYALLGEGKRLRPAITLLTVKSLQMGGEASFAAVAVECLHAASLVADDLPCMDDDDLRRKRPSVHKAFNEGIALLASYTLISAAYDCIYRNGELLKADAGHLTFDNIEQRTVLALECLARNTGIHGATGGQFLDVFLKNPNEQQMKSIIHGKTGTLFEIAFVLGWLYGGGEITALEKIRSAARHFGLAFQIVDDFDDLSQDLGHEGSINYVQLVGADRALQTIEKELAAFDLIIKNLCVEKEEWAALSSGLLQLAKESWAPPKPAKGLAPFGNPF